MSISGAMRRGKLAQAQRCDLSPALRAYYENERRRVIAKLRDLDRMLGNAQTIPERQR